MTPRFTQEQVDTWRREGAVLIERFFTPEEVAAVQADFVTVFGREAGGREPLTVDRAGAPGSFHQTQFASSGAIPFDCSPALNLIGVHPELIRFARAALKTRQVHIYQCLAWAKFTGDSDYDQPLHCDFSNHTLTVPAEDECLNAVTILCYFTDVTEAHGPMHYVTRTRAAPVAGPAANFTSDAHDRLAALEQTSASPAGSIFPYSIDVYHRGTNLTAPGGRRFAVMACFKRSDNDAIGFHAWPYSHTRPWHRIFEHATPDQLSCFGVHPPGHPFWTEVTLARAAARYPGWDLGPYRAAMEG